MKLSLICIIAFLFTELSGHNPNQENGTSITGVVYDEGGTALIFANVLLYQNKVLLTATSSDFDGKYAFHHLEPGIYDVLASYTGYVDQLRKDVLVAAGKPTQCDFSLMVGVVLDQVYVVDYAIPLSKSCRGTTLPVKSRNKRHLPTKEVSALAAQCAGIEVSDGSNVSIRGSRTNAHSYYIDGVRVSGSHNPSGHHNRHCIQDLSREQYSLIRDNTFLAVSQNPLSTFSVDVDRASYSNVRTFLRAGQLPPADAVRVEEMVNYFAYDYPQPGDAPVSITTEMHTCPWNTNHKLLHIGLQGRKMDLRDIPPSNLVFLIDVSGSMNMPDKLPLVISSFKLLTEQLREQDNIAIVVYAGVSGLVLPPTSGADKQTIIHAIEKLRPGGSTAGAAGIVLAYETARQHFIAGGNNRVILATDGDFNVGVSSDGELVRIIEKERESGVFLSVLGFGTGNYQDSKMQQLADHGNGNHAYIDCIEEAKKVLVSEFSGTLVTIASDVKLQVEFNPAYISSYRLIGYENRMLAAEDFNDDRKDAGEIGVGHTVTALYEIVPAGVTDTEMASVDPLRYQFKAARNTIVTHEWLTVKFRYKLPGESTSRKVEHMLPYMIGESDAVSENFTWSAAVAAFGMILRNSEFKGESNIDMVKTLAKQGVGDDTGGYRTEFLKLLESAVLNTAHD